jgi:peptidoglycan/xylan/chitin deacetylase (PgdA/CDA1 family)
MRLFVIIVCAVIACASSRASRASGCAGDSGAIGTSRVIVVDPSEHPRVGWMQYKDRLPLEDHEVVLSFDDGPSARFTPRVLDILAKECVKATFFMVGRMAAESPGVVKRAFAEGHTIATHTQNHPLNMRRLPIKRAKREIDDGVASVAAALGDSGAVAPFFRIPCLDRSRAIEAHAISRGLMIWSADIDADDWTPISPHQVATNVLSQLERRGRALVELHDIQERTVLALPELLQELKKRGFHIVHVRPVRDGQPKTVVSKELWRYDP